MVQLRGGHGLILRLPGTLRFTDATSHLPPLRDVQKEAYNSRPMEPCSDTGCGPRQFVCGTFRAADLYVSTSVTYVPSFQRRPHANRRNARACGKDTLEILESISLSPRLPYEDFTVVPPAKCPPSTLLNTPSPANTSATMPAQPPIRRNKSSTSP